MDFAEGKQYNLIDITLKGPQITWISLPLPGMDPPPSATILPRRGPLGDAVGAPLLRAGPSPTRAGRARARHAQAPVCAWHRRAQREVALEQA